MMTTSFATTHIVAHLLKVSPSLRDVHVVIVGAAAASGKYADEHGLSKGCL